MNLKLVCLYFELMRLRTVDSFFITVIVKEKVYRMELQLIFLIILRMVQRLFWMNYAFGTKNIDLRYLISADPLKVQLVTD